MWKNYSVSIYPKECPDFKKIEEYLQLSKKYGCKEIFSSAHLPELTCETQYDFIIQLCKLVHEYDMKLCVDLGGKEYLNLLKNKTYCRLFKEVHIDAIRLDYGISPSIVIDSKEQLGTECFVINASILDEHEIKEYMKFDVELKACHNFYPRLQTGIDEDFALQQYALFQRLGLDVVCCVPSHTNPRGPMFEGLPTLEKHRYLEFERCLVDVNQFCDEILIGDEWLKEEEFKVLKQIGDKRIIDLHVHLDEQITKQEKKIVLSAHQFRYDSNSIILRSQSSRQMAEFADQIEQRNCIYRKKNVITIDNEKSLRYSGELQVVLKDLDMDSHVNVVGTIANQDEWKLAYFRYGFIYHCKEE